MLKNMFKNIDKTLLKRLGIPLGIIIVLIIVMIIIMAIVGGEDDYAAVRNQLKAAAIIYFNDNEDLLPTEEEPETSVSAETLAGAELILPLSELLKDETCTGEVRVIKNVDKFHYFPILNCKSYSNVTIKEAILKDNPIVETRDGLYENEEQYIFRGEHVKNYIRFNDGLWRIIRINSDGSIRIISEEGLDPDVWDDRFNAVRDDIVGINDYHRSRILYRINALYNAEFFSEDSKGKMLLFDVCYGRRRITSTNKSGTSDCRQVDANRPVDLLRVHEYMYASLDENCRRANSRSCSNYNYFSGGIRTWSFITDADSTHRVYSFTGRTFVLSTAINEIRIRPVVHISGHLEHIDGNGTLENPYIIR